MSRILVFVFVSSLALPTSHAAEPLTEFTNSIGMKFNLIPAGEFMMGSAQKLPALTASLVGTSEFSPRDERPQHKVRITKAFYLGVTEVTQGQYEEVMGNKAEFSRQPAYYVDWHQAVAFCEKLSASEGRNYRLPTEAEWEYACRAGSTTAWSFGDDSSRLGEYAWYRGNSGQLVDGGSPWKDKAREIREKYEAKFRRPHVVAQKKPNPWGLYDMHGNVYEWCSDRYGWNYYGYSEEDDPLGPGQGISSHLVLRGGGCNASASSCRSASRHHSRPLSSAGFRVVAVLPASQAADDSGANRERRGVKLSGELGPSNDAADSSHSHANSIGMRFRQIPAGEFLMGGSRTPQELAEIATKLFPKRVITAEDFPDERPRHRVQITKPFWLGATEITQAQYEKVMGKNPSSIAVLFAYFEWDIDMSCFPVESVTWEEAVQFCEKLSEMEGRKYRLPTEAEWEYACRAGTTTVYGFGDEESQLDNNDWFGGNSGHTLPWNRQYVKELDNLMFDFAGTGCQSYPVGRLKPNAWGLYDMHGNVSEWCGDRYGEDGQANLLTDDSTGTAAGSQRVVRGGNWFSPAVFCRSASRFSFPTTQRSAMIGFRVVLETPAED